MPRRTIIGGLIIIFSVLLSSFSFYFYQVFNTPNVLIDRQDSFFEIPDSANFDWVRNELYDRGWLGDPIAFGALARFLNYDEHIRPGRYLIKGNSSNYACIKLLRSGAQTPVNITFNNVRFPIDLAEKITSNIQLTDKEFMAKFSNDSVARHYGFNKENFITMFIPNTYEVYWTISADGLFDRMHNEYQAFWNAERMAKAQALNMSPMEVTTLASIVQDEAFHKEELPIIAGLYLNRIKRGMPLQADPSIKFALGDFSIQRLLNDDKLIDSPYNTYKYRGLPPGPINLPQVNVIDAVLNYQSHDYIYMCAREDFSQYHNFSTNLRDHTNNARRYQAALNREKIYR